MQVINEVREDRAHKETLYPVATAANSAASLIKVTTLNKQLEKNRRIFQGLVSKLRNRFNGALNKFSPSELKVYKQLEHVNLIKEYRAVYLDDKRVKKYNPGQTDKLIPLEAKAEKKAPKPTAEEVKAELAKKEAALAAKAKAEKEAKEAKEAEELAAKEKADKEAKAKKKK